MARIVLGLASSHTPQMSSGPEHWEGHAGRDRRNPFLVATDGEVRSFEELSSRPREGLEAELAPEVWEAKFARAQAAVEALSRALAQSRPDVAVVIGDDQRELFGDEGNPAIGLFLGEELWDLGLSEEHRRRMPPDILPAQWAAHADSPEPYPVAKEMSWHLAEALVGAGFDVGVFARQGEGRTLGHAFTFPRRRLGLPPTTPIVPVALNTYYPPNVPAPGRCWALGRALREALEAWGGAERVALVASGGLSHFVVSEDLDHRVLSALGEGDADAVAALPRQLLRSGSSEILNWIVLGGALAGWRMEVVDYIPAYRSLAGTGVGMGFASWSPAA